MSHPADVAYNYTVDELSRVDSHGEEARRPAIERKVKDKRGMEWPTLEWLVSSEFKARARMHLSATLIPADEFTWLALMQHYAVPTRLLDFTYSPFVALYFAIRDGQEGSKRKYARFWAVDAVAVNTRFMEVARKVEVVSEKGLGDQPRKRAISMDPDNFVSQRDIMTTELNFHERAARLLSATGKRRGVMRQEGCVCAASPPAFNPWLVSQQGAFMFNCADDLGFQESLKKMMAGWKGEWCKTFDIPVEQIPEIVHWGADSLPRGQSHHQMT